MQFFVEENRFYAYDPGFRLQGEAPHIHLAHINGFDHRKMLVNFALTGTFGEADFLQKNDPRFKGKSACTIWVLLTDGKIGSIKGLDDLKSDKKIANVLDRFKTGDVVTPDMLGTERQVFARIYIEGNSTPELNQKIDEIKNNLIIHDEQGKDMILYWVDPSIINN